MKQPFDSDFPSPIDVFRDESATSDARRSRPSDPQSDLRDQRIQELAERVRDAIVRQRVADGVGERLEEALRDRVRDVLRSRFMRDLRNALREVALARLEPDDVGDILDDALSDVIEDRVRDVLREHLGAAVRERASDAIRSAVAQSTLTGGLSPEAANELVDALDDRLEDTVREQLHDGLHGAAKERLREIARQRLLEALRQAVEARPQVGTDVDRVVAAIAERLETTLQDHVADALRERLRAILSTSVGSMNGDRLRDTLRRSGFRRTVDRRRPAGEPIDRRVWIDEGGRLESRLAQALEDRIRTRFTDGLREQLELTMRETVARMARTFGLLEEWDAERVPVVDGGKLVGVLSRSVLQRRLAEDEPPADVEAQQQV